MTAKQIVANVYPAARRAGLKVADARAAADRVAQRVILGGESLDLATADELALTRGRLARPKGSTS